MRVSQLDSHLLDQELFTLLSQNIDSALSLYRTKDTVSLVSKTVLRALIWKLGIWDHDISYGSQMQSLRYMNLTRNKKVILGIVTVFGPLLQETVGGRLRGKWRSLASQAEAIFEVLSLANFISYIAGSRYDSVLHRILGIHLKPISSAYRAVSFEFLNRQLIWSQFTEFLLVFLPLLNLPRLKRKIVGLLPRIEHQRLTFLPKHICAICYSEGAETSDCVVPFQADCGDVFCYGCIASQLALAEGEGWECLRCGRRTFAAAPYMAKAETTQELPVQTARLTHVSEGDSSGEDSASELDETDGEDEDDKSVSEADREGGKSRGSASTSDSESDTEI